MSYMSSLLFLSYAVSSTSNVFMSLIYAVLLFINASITLLMLGFEFLALVNILVYVGALAVLFLFVIMLLEIPSISLRSYNRGYSSMVWLLLLFPLISMNSITPLWSFACTSECISAIGHSFYVIYADILILNSLVLTIALIGALILSI